MLLNTWYVEKNYTIIVKNFDEHWTKPNQNIMYGQDLTDKVHQDLFPYFEVLFEFQNRLRFCHWFRGTLIIELLSLIFFLAEKCGFSCLLREFNVIESSFWRSRNGCLTLSNILRRLLKEQDLKWNWINNDHVFIRLYFLIPL